MAVRVGMEGTDKKMEEKKSNDHINPKLHIFKFKKTATKELSDGCEDLECRITNRHIKSTFDTAIHSEGTVQATM